MVTKRIHELAKELGLASRDVLATARELGLPVTTASSGLEPGDAEALRSILLPDEPDEEVEEPPTVAPAPVEADHEEAEVDEVELITVPAGVSVLELARAMRRPAGELVRHLLSMGLMAAAAAPVPEDAIDALGEAFGFLIEVEPEKVMPESPGVLVKPKRVFEDDPASLVDRPAVVTVMGHVDHGKTTLLDEIRNTNVVAGEAGGITQHIGAYQTSVEGRRITFIDTPGHAAFTAMRARGAEVTDIVVLVVAADDGVMPQTIEAISHAQAAGVALIVAINKMDLESADPIRVRAMLTEYGVVTEELGGDVISVEMSASNGEGIDDLLEMVDLVSQVSEFKANPRAPASGVVIESHLDRGLGPIATVIVQRGTLKRGNSIVAGTVSGRVRAMIDDKGKRISSTGPSSPVLVSGWASVPTAGDLFEVVKNDRIARSIASERVEAHRAKTLVVPTARERLGMLLERLRSQEEAELRLIIKADADGSVEAIKDAVSKVAREGGRVTVVHSGVGGITENDITLADATDSIVIGFNVRPDAKSRRAASAASIEVMTYSIIYELLDEIEQMLVGRLAPVEEETVLGTAEVRATFRVPRLGAVAGCYVTEGIIPRDARARLVRDGVVVYDGKVISLRRFKDDVSEVASGYECGVGLERFRDVKEGDIIETYRIDEVAAL
ncbi:MAG: translation initiation factor IF-2 [bacterium]|nr:translation initiation factor IF-2 [bacterium]MDE0288995.1 translation initiation factor IF-2 [bacterium]MDE0439919.1 translation initiation factor IF-2 [bacterium]